MSWLALSSTGKLSCNGHNAITLTRSSQRLLHRLPSLRNSENEVPLLLVWSLAVDGRPFLVTWNWALRGMFFHLRGKLIQRFAEAQSPEQLALNLSTLLCYWRLAPHDEEEDIYSITGWCFSDLTGLLQGSHVKSERHVLKSWPLPF